MRLFLLLIMGALLGQVVKATDFKDTDFAKLVTKADKIVYGRIIELKESSFIFKIEESITHDTGIIEVNKLIESEWSAKRWTPYEEYQCMLLFLEQRGDKLNVIGGQNEGEFPIKKNIIFIPSNALPIPPPPPLDGSILDSSLIYFTPKNIIIDSSIQYYFWGIEWDLVDLISDIEFIRKNLKYQNKYSDSRKNWELVGTKEEVLERASQSKIIAWCFASKLGITNAN